MWIRIACHCWQVQIGSDKSLIVRSESFKFGHHLINFIYQMAEHNRKFKAGLINGSLRKHSNNAGLARIVQSLSPPNFEIVHIRIDDLPFMNEDLQVFSDGGKTVTLPHIVDNVRETVRGLDALLISCPQNNGGISAVLKNTWDWLSRDYTRFGSTNTSPLDSVKKIGIVGSSYFSDQAGKDLKAMAEGRKINVFSKVFYMKMHGNFDDKGNLTNNQEKTNLTSWSNEFYEWVVA